MPEAEAEAAKILSPLPDAQRQPALEAEICKAVARLSAADALVGALVKACLDPDPWRRPTASAVLRHELFSLASKVSTRFPAHWERGEAEAAADGLALHALRSDEVEWCALAACLATDGKQLNIGVDYREPGNHVSLELVRAWRVENRHQWSTYRTAQKRVEAEVCRARGAGVAVHAVASRLAAATRTLPGQRELQPSMNEAYLLHGTSPSNLLAVIAGGLNERYSAVAAYGDGNYLAEDAAKCDQYVTSDAAFGGDLEELHERLYPGGQAEHPDKVYYLLLCRTTLGVCLRTRTFVRNGCVSLDTGSKVFPSSTRELALIAGVSPPVHHHGLVVENGGPAGIRFREFAVFHGE